MSKTPDSVLLESIRLRNFLSYGSDEPALALRPLNVFIGANGSGKSNLIEAISLLHATPGDFTKPIREGGGVTDWLWKGTSGSGVAEIEATVNYPAGLMPLRYRVAFAEAGQRMELVDEAIENESAQDEGQDEVPFFYRYQQGEPVFNYRVGAEQPEGVLDGRIEHQIRRQDLEPNRSVLSQRKDPDRYPELTYLGRQFERIRFFREWNAGRSADVRMPQKVDLPDDFLLESASNLGLIVNSLEHEEGKERLLKGLREILEGVEDITTRLQGGTVQLFLRERGLRKPIPAARLSDGTLQYLCLLAVLTHPNLPPLICIEEPELGLHPDVLSPLADLLIEASERTQLMVTTHSDVLVSALSDTPESVVICERDNTGTHLKRLEKEQLTEWLEDYSLGELWTKGEIGGTR